MEVEQFHNSKLMSILKALKNMFNCKCLTSPFDFFGLGTCLSGFTGPISRCREDCNVVCFFYMVKMSVLYLLLYFTCVSKYRNNQNVCGLTKCRLA